jgi:hypothetical protein
MADPFCTMVDMPIIHFHLLFSHESVILEEIFYAEFRKLHPSRAVTVPFLS